MEHDLGACDPEQPGSTNQEEDVKGVDDDDGDEDGEDDEEDVAAQRCQCDLISSASART